MVKVVHAKALQWGNPYKKGNLHVISGVGYVFCNITHLSLIEKKNYYIFFSAAQYAGQ